MRAKYVPRKGDFMTMMFDPQSDHEHESANPFPLAGSSVLFSHWLRDGRADQIRRLHCQGRQVC